MGRGSSGEPAGDAGGASRGEPQESDFALDEAPVPEPGPGEVLVHNLYVSVDPYQRGRMSEARSYAKPLELGDVITSQAVGRSGREQ